MFVPGQVEQGVGQEADEMTLGILLVEKGFPKNRISTDNNRTEIVVRSRDGILKGEAEDVGRPHPAQVSAVQIRDQLIRGDAQLNARSLKLVRCHDPLQNLPQFPPVQRQYGMA